MIRNIYSSLFVLVVFASLTLSPPAMASDPQNLEDEYAAKGWNPGKKPAGVPDYEGWVELKR